MITQKRLKELLDYEPETGVFYRKTNAGGNAVGSKIGTTIKNGYTQIKADKASYYAHRLAWLYTHGTWPNGDVDHINHDRKDNRISNLRDVSRSENLSNRHSKYATVSGVIGVNLFRNGKWHARFHGKHLGYFSDIHDAIRARKNAENNLNEAIK